MTKVQITYMNRQAIVDSDQVSKLRRKMEIVWELLEIRNDPREYQRAAALHRQLVRLNRTIRQNVQFIS